MFSELHGRLTIPAKYLDRYKEEQVADEDAGTWGVMMPSSGEEDMYNGGREFILTSFLSVSRHTTWQASFMPVTSFTTL